MWQALVLCCAFVGEAPAVEARFVQIHPAPASARFQRTPGRDCAVVLIHGFCFCLTDADVRAAGLQGWQEGGSDLVNELSGYADVYAFCYGQNAAVDEVARVPLLRRRIGEIRDLKYRHIVLVGHSAGGLVARHFVEGYPDAGVTKVIQVCAPNGGSPLARLAEWLQKWPVIRVSQRPFVASLAHDARRRAAQGCRPVPADIQFLCVVGTRDWVVPCDSQWTADLQNQGIPALAVPFAHDSAMCRGDNARRLCALVLREHPRWTAAQVDAARVSISAGRAFGNPGPDGPTLTARERERFLPITVGGQPWRGDACVFVLRRSTDSCGTAHAASWSVQGVTCSTLVVLALAAPAAPSQADETAVVARGKKLIRDNAEKICLFAHAYSSYGYRDNEFIGWRKTKDGYHELTYRFTVKGNFRTQTMQMGFYFHQSGAFEFLRVKDYSTIYEPFNRLSTSYLKELREEMGRRPLVQSNTELLRVVDVASARELCEMYLKFAQANKR